MRGQNFIRAQQNTRGKDKLFINFRGNWDMQKVITLLKSGRAQRPTSCSYQTSLNIWRQQMPWTFTLCLFRNKTIPLDKLEGTWHVKHHGKKCHLMNPSHALGRRITWLKKSCPLCIHLVWPCLSSKMLGAIGTRGEIDAALPCVHLPTTKVTQKSFIRWTQVPFAGAALIMCGFPICRW